MAKTKNIHKLKVDASTEHLAEVRDFVANHASQMGLSDKDISDIRLAVDEAYTNIIKHAYQNKSSNPVEIEIGHNNSELWISLSDNGHPFDPSGYQEPDIYQRIKDKKRGGMGVYLIRKLMDHVQYNTRGKTNVIRMVKNL